jgi:hypothetical protein
MAFSRVCILQEFVEAAAHAKTWHRPYRWEWRPPPEPYHARPSAPCAPIVPVASRIIFCPICDTVCEMREGTTRITHFGKNIRCSYRGKETMRTIHAGDILMWVYPRDEGDIEVFAKTKEEAVAAIRAGGFLVTEPGRIRFGGARLTDHLKREQIK